ncbi:hypothetical protein KLP28_15550 [Nocardioidaceae bacterium]|nr:hypothetical protein KLP28_15550 [Nocardioidaceae bacterium]
MPTTDSASDRGAVAGSASGPAAASLDHGVRVGLVVAVVLVLLTMSVPEIFGWLVHPFGGPNGVEPLHSRWSPHLGPGTVPAVVLAVLGVLHGPRLAAELGWRRLLLAVFGLGWLWIVSLALVDGVSGLGSVLGEPFEYFREARRTEDVGLLLEQWVDRIPFAHPDTLAANVAGHPPFLFLLFVAMERLGFDPAPFSGLIVVTVSATAPVAVLVAARRLAGEAYARRAAPFLVLAPMAVFIGVSADSMVTAVGAWGIALLAYAATSRGLRAVAWSLAAGLVLGSAVMMSYGAVLLGLVALAVLLAVRSWWPLPLAALAACVPTLLVLAPFGWHFFPAYFALEDRYWNGIAGMRPPAYWVWGNGGALLLSAGPALAAALAVLVVVLRSRRRSRGRWADLLDDGSDLAVVVGGPLADAQVRTRAAVLLPLGGLACVLVADLSLMSLSEVERIWLPFMPWMLLAAAHVPRWWWTRLLGLQVTVALLLNHLLDTHW